MLIHYFLLTCLIEMSALKKNLTLITFLLIKYLSEQFNRILLNIVHYL